MKGAGGGEIVQVQGGHILRSTSRKDRHSKVYTAKGPRDRRVRLSAHTAIQFYDVQDRLGYDRPSKAVDWLINKAKTAIDKLAELPPWNPIDSAELAPNAEPDNPGSSNSVALQQRLESDSGYSFQLQKQLDEHPTGNSSFMPQATDSESIAETMKSFFPTSSGISLMNFQNYPHDTMSRASLPSEDLGLSLHILQESSSSHRPSTDQVHFSDSNPLSFESNYGKAAGWNGNGENGMGYIFSSQHPLFFQSLALSQREPLQSNYTNLIQAWDNRSLGSEDHNNAQTTHQSSICSGHFAADFHVPARIQGGEEEPEVLPLRPSSTSPVSHY